jgi:hypothetical protein
MHDHLRARLIASPVGALVPAVNGIRAISWGERPPGAGFPAIVLTLITPGRDYTHSGFDNLPRPRVQFDVMATTVGAVNALSATLITELESQDDVVSGGTTVRFHHGFIVADQGPIADDLGGGTGGVGADARVFRRVIECEFFWEIV